MLNVSQFGFVWFFIFLVRLGWLISIKTVGCLFSILGCTPLLHSLFWCQYFFSFGHLFFHLPSLCSFDMIHPLKNFFWAFFSFWYKGLQAHLLFPFPDLQSAFSPRIPIFFYWRMVCRNQDLGAGCAFDSLMCSCF